MSHELQSGSDDNAPISFREKVAELSTLYQSADMENLANREDLNSSRGIPPEGRFTYFPLWDARNQLQKINVDEYGGVARVDTAEGRRFFSSQDEDAKRLLRTWKEANLFWGCDYTNLKNRAHRLSNGLKVGGIVGKIAIAASEMRAIWGVFSSNYIRNKSELMPTADSLADELFFSGSGLIAAVGWKIANVRRAKSYAKLINEALIIDKPDDAESPIPTPGITLPYVIEDVEIDDGLMCAIKQFEGRYLEAHKKKFWEDNADQLGNFIKISSVNDSPVEAEFRIIDNHFTTICSPNELVKYMDNMKIYKIVDPKNRNKKGLYTSANISPVMLIEYVLSSVSKDEIDDLWHNFLSDAANRLADALTKLQSANSDMMAYESRVQSTGVEVVSARKEHGFFIEDAKQNITFAVRALFESASHYKILKENKEQLLELDTALVKQHAHNEAQILEWSECLRRLIDTEVGGSPISGLYTMLSGVGADVVQKLLSTGRIDVAKDITDVITSLHDEKEPRALFQNYAMLYIKYYPLFPKWEDLSVGLTADATIDPTTLEQVDRQAMENMRAQYRKVALLLRRKIAEI